MRMRRFTTIALMLLLVASTATCVFASTPENLTSPQVVERLNNLSSKLAGKYFTTTGKEWTSNVGDTCNMTEVIKSKTFKSKVDDFVPDQTGVSGTFRHFYNGGTLTRGWSCCGFANYAEWYLFARKTSDTVQVKEIDFVKFNKANMIKYAQVGDVLRFGNSKSSSAHSAILYSISDDYIYVVDSNWSTTPTNKVKKHTINYSSYTYVGISRAKNYDYSTGYYTISYDKHADGLILRETTDTTSTILTRVPDGTKVKILETEKNWGKYEYNGITGWSNMDYMYFNGTYVNQLTFDANGGQGTMETTYFDVGSGFYTPACTFEKAGYEFVGWTLQNKDLNEWRCKNYETGKMAWLKNEEMGENDQIYLYAENQKFNLSSREIKGADFVLVAQWNPKGAILKDITKESVAVDTSNVFYTGSPQKPVVTFEGLMEGKDYSVSYAGNTDIGSATVTITGIGNYTGVMCYVFDIALAPPAASAANAASSGKIKVSWGAVPGADRYEVYRSTSKNGTYKKMFTTTKTSYTNTSAKAGTLYYYKVKAIWDKDEKYNSQFGNRVSRRCDLARPTVKATLTSSKAIKLSWNKVAGADRYKVYWSASRNGTYTWLYTTTKTAVTAKSVAKGKTYYFKVKAIYDDNAAANSAYSTIVSKKVQ